MNRAQTCLLIQAVSELKTLGCYAFSIAGMDNKETAKATARKQSDRLEHIVNLLTAIIDDETDIRKAGSSHD